MSDFDSLRCDLTVIGAGMAGMTATLFAVNRGISVMQVGSASEIGFASGLIDLLGVHPMREGNRLEDPWTGIEALVKDIPLHPYARLGIKEIRTAFEEFFGFLQNSGLPYSTELRRNVRVVTPMGTIKTTYGVPKTMWGGVKALEQKQPCLLVDFRGLKGFSAKLIVRILDEDWSGLHAARISFPGTEHMDEVLPEHMANALVISQNREKLAKRIRPLVKNARIVGVPAILGLYKSHEVASEMEELIGVPIFEIPTMPPSIPGLRLKEAFERGLREKRSYYFSQSRVFKAEQDAGEGFRITIGRGNVEQTVLSKGVILATGRFIGGGLSADRTHIRETIFNLPVSQPEKRSQWHREDLLDPRGHPINRAGLEIDSHFHPLDNHGQPAFKTLYGVGSILAHQDWKRMKCGVGLAVATSFGAVNAFINDIGI
jgi:glycerol-3-phosphate dehydrogenase subunit B